jgi:hypothetical protein
MIHIPFLSRLRRERDEARRIAEKLYAEKLAARAERIMRAKHARGCQLQQERDAKLSMLGRLQGEVAMMQGIGL